ncbi:MAG TPA: proteasome subunit beta [Streptosporangiaceae bacterium]|jgi:proteasome beta subunit|nr:proteasome subunit beta [Streptosporangiaceae bacterium]
MYVDLCGRRVPFQALGSSSFAGFLSSYAPQLLPGGSLRDFAGAGGTAGVLTHATTIVAVVCDEGVVLASDRRATAGSMISKRDVEKVFRCDQFSAVGVAGVLALALELARLFQVELEHYEKMEGRSLSLEGKANRLATMIRGNLGLAMQGLVMVPLLAGYDLDSGAGRIFSYDPTGGPSEEHRFYSIGSGSVFAGGALKKLYTEDMPTSEAVLCCLQALYDAADDDSATGGPDMTRRIFPVVTTVTGNGFRRLPEAEVAEAVQRVVADRMDSPDGPNAPLRD